MFSVPASFSLRSALVVLEVIERCLRVRLRAEEEIAATGGKGFNLREMAVHYRHVQAALSGTKAVAYLLANTVCLS